MTMSACAPSPSAVLKLSTFVATKRPSPASTISPSLPTLCGIAFSIVGVPTPMMERGARFSNRVPHRSLTLKDAA